MSSGALPLSKISKAGRRDFPRKLIFRAEKYTKPCTISGTSQLENFKRFPFHRFKSFLSSAPPLPTSLHLLSSLLLPLSFSHPHFSQVLTLFVKFSFYLLCFNIRPENVNISTSEEDVGEGFSKQTLTSYVHIRTQNKGTEFPSFYILGPFLLQADNDLAPTHTHLRTRAQHLRLNNVVCGFYRYLNG
jgi:hypothetical protein